MTIPASTIGITNLSELSGKLLRGGRPGDLASRVGPADSAWQRKLRAKIEQGSRGAGAPAPGTDRPEGQNPGESRAANKREHAAGAAPTDAEDQSTNDAAAGDEPLDGSQAAQKPVGVQDAQGGKDAPGASAADPASRELEGGEDRSSEPGPPTGASSTGAPPPEGPLTIKALNAALAQVDLSVLPKDLLRDLGLLRSPGGAGDAIDQGGSGEPAEDGATQGWQETKVQANTTVPSGPAGGQQANGEPGADSQAPGGSAEPGSEGEATRKGSHAGPIGHAGRSGADRDGPTADASGLADAAGREAAGASTGPGTSATGLIARLDVAHSGRLFELGGARGTAGVDHQPGGRAVEGGRTGDAFADQVARGLAGATERAGGLGGVGSGGGGGGGGGEVTLRLRPMELGALRINVSLQGEGVSVRFEAATAEAGALIEKAMPELRRGLEEKGLVVREATVQVADGLAAQAGADVRPLAHAWNDSGATPQDASHQQSGGPGDGRAGEQPAGGQQGGGDGGGWGRGVQQPAEAAETPRPPADGWIEGTTIDGLRLRLNAVA